MRKLLTILMFVMMIGLVTPAQDSLGTYKQGEDVILLQICGTCSYNNITSIVLPNSTHLPVDTEMTKRGMEYTYEFSQTDLVGTYLVNGVGDLDGTANAWAYEFSVTPTGTAVPDNLSFMLAAIFIIVFGVACFFLYLSSQTMEVGPKLFFFIASLVFLIGSISIAAVVATDSNVSANINSTITYIITALGMIIFVIIAYIMIKQTVSIMEAFKVKRGLAVGGSARFGYGSYNNAQGIM